MASIRITRPYTMPDKDVRDAAQGLAAKLERDHGIKARWAGDSVSISGSGVDGKLSFGDGVIDVSVKLGLMASMYQPVFRKEINRYLDKHVN